MKEVVVDIGYSAAKGAMGSRTSLIPSVVGSAISAANFSVGDVGLTLVEDGKLYPVGQTALRHSRYSSGRRDSSWVCGPEWMRLLRATFSELLLTPYTKILLVTGLPVYDWEDQHKMVEQKLTTQIAWMRQGQQRQIAEIERVLVTAQPYGSLLDKALDDNGNARKNVWSDGMVAVIDLGGLTLNLLAAEALLQVGRLTHSYEFGLLATLDQIRDAIRQRFSRMSPSTHEVSEWLAKGYFMYRGEQQDILPIAEPILEPLVDVMMTRLDATWPEAARMDAVLLTGGGAMAIGKFLRKRMTEYANVEIADDARWANLRGYRKIAARMAHKEMPE